MASVVIMILWFLNINKITNMSLYILLGIMLWLIVLKSGVHATLAGVILGAMIPYKDNQIKFNAVKSSLYIPVNYVILPLFAFFNAGIVISDLDIKNLYHDMTIGIIAGLFIGKQIGVLLFTYLLDKFKIIQLPEMLNWKMIYGVAILSGIGFTMSLFMGSLAVININSELINNYRLGIILASLLSGTIGYWYLKRVLTPKGS